MASLLHNQSPRIPDSSGIMRRFEMAYEKVSRPNEANILRVVRELTSDKPKESGHVDREGTEVPTEIKQAMKLRSSLEAKKNFFNVVQGFMDKKEVATIQAQLEEALDDLDSIIAG
jgi:hypothetical protein